VAPAGDSRVESVEANLTSTNVLPAATARVANRDSARSEPEPPEEIAGRTPEPEATVAPTTASASTATPRPQSPTAADSFDPAGLSVGPGSGFIPLDEPVMIPAAEATWLDDEEIVMGLVAKKGETRAFPIRQMAYHHIVNLTVGGEPYLVTY